MGQRDLAKAEARDAHLLAECGGVVKSVPRQNVQPALTTGLLSLQPHPAVGTLFPQPWIDHDGAKLRLDQRAGTGWRVIVSASADHALLPSEVGVQRPAIKMIDMAALDFQELDKVVENWFLQHGCSAAIVRPDHYVYGVANSADALAKQLDVLAQSYRQMR